MPSSIQSISIVIPIYNEEESLPELYAQLLQALSVLNVKFEMILVNDGSEDRTQEILDEISRKDSRVKAVHFRRNFGQTAAMMAGVDYAQGQIIIPMDGDLQNDPADIKKLLDKINEGYDVVSGWRKDRKDNPIKRNFLSRVANSLISFISGVHLHDYGCSLKAYKKEIIKGVKLYGEMHRFIPIYAKWQGARVAEVAVTHHPRKFGSSKYGMNRIIKVLLDLIVVEFLHKYSTKPIYIFGGFGFLSFFVSFLALAGMIYYKLWGGKTFIETPLPLIVVFAFLLGFMSVLMGLLAELMVRTYHESQGKSIYAVSYIQSGKKKTNAR